MQDPLSILVPGVLIAGTLVALVAVFVLVVLLWWVRRARYLSQAGDFARQHGLRTTPISLSGMDLALSGSFEGAEIQTKLSRFHHQDDEGVGLYAEVYQIEILADPGETWLIVRRMPLGEEFTKPALPDYTGEFPTGYPRFDGTFHVKADVKPTNPLFTDDHRLSALLALNTNAVLAVDGKVVGYFHRNVIWKYNGFARVERMIRLMRGMVG